MLAPVHDVAELCFKLDSMSHCLLRLIGCTPWGSSSTESNAWKADQNGHAGCQPGWAPAGSKESRGHSVPRPR